MYFEWNEVIKERHANTKQKNINKTACFDHNFSLFKPYIKPEND